MCGRFTLTADTEQLQKTFPQFSFPAQFAPRFNVAPTQPILAVANDGKNAADFFVWGLIPSWAKDPEIGNRLINARAETLAEKPSFRGSYRYKRCLIFADGFYEWKAQPGTKTKAPYFIRLASGLPFAFAGLWGTWDSPDGSQLNSATIITTEPNSLLATLHNRMPVILGNDTYTQWLDTAPQKPEDLQPLLKPFAADQMAAHPVSTLVNSPVNDGPELIQPLAG
jgi:putative SOS response-associated peptidase YedK